MRVALLCDVHGNLPALEAVLAEAASLEVDRIVSGGDVVAGPFPRDCLERLVDRGALFVRGNGDREPGDWVAEQLDPLALAFLRELPVSATLDGVRYCHGSPRSDTEILTRVSPDERLRAALAGVEERVVAGGHTHVQFERELDGIHFVNAGSVGQPSERQPGAYWALLDGREVELRRTPYALAAAAVLIRASGYPEAEAAAAAILAPPDPDEVSAYFESLAA
jgi:putative phosphoesterase